MHLKNINLSDYLSMPILLSEYVSPIHFIGSDYLCAIIDFPTEIDQNELQSVKC